MTWSMNTPSPGWAAIPIHPSPMPSSAFASAISEPPPELPSNTTDSAPRATMKSCAAFTSVMQFSCRQSVSLLM